MLRSVIRLGARVLRDRHNHFSRGLRDPQLTFVLFDCVVVRLEVFAFRKGDLVLHLTLGNGRHAASRLDIRHFTGNKALAASYVRFRQRFAVVDLASALACQRHAALIDRQRSRIRRRNDILSCRVNLANRIVVKRNSVCIGILSHCARFGNTFKGNAIRRTGKAGNALLLSIISLRVAVRLQLDVLIIVESDYVLGRIRANRDRLGGSRYRRVALDPDGGFRFSRCLERLAANGLGFRDRLGRPVPVVVHRVAQVGLLLIIDLNNVLAFIRSNRQRAVLRLFELIPIFRLESESVFIDLTSVQRTDGIGF